MLAKTVFVAFVAILSVSLAKEDELVHQVLGTGSVIIKEIAKMASNDPEKYIVDLNSMYKKYGVEEKADQARSYLLTQFKRGIELTNEYLKQKDLKHEEHLKKGIELIKKDEPVLGEKLTKFYDMACELDRIAEDIIKYVLDADKIQGYYDKTKAPLEQKMIEIIKKFESGLLDGIKRSKKI